MSFPDKERRKKCWDARDVYWECLDKSISAEDGKKRCKKLREIFIEECPPQWIGHFDRKYEFLKYKEKIARDGYQAADSKLD